MKFSLKKAWSQRALGVGMSAFAGVVVMVAYLGICSMVHEDGQRTLLGSLFYFEHALRELPLDLLLALAIGGSAIAILPQAERPSAQARRRRATGLALLACFAIATILAGTVWRVGASGALDNFLQYHTRPGAPLEWGSHWRYHLLSRLALLMLAVGLSGILQTLIGGEQRKITRAGPLLVASSLAAFLAFTILFSAGLRSLLAPLRDPVYIGHQAREIFTHLLVTIPAAWGLCLLFARRAEDSNIPERSAPHWWTLFAVATGVVGALLGVAVCLASLMVDAASHGQSADLAILLFPHFFEHGFGYLVVPVTAALVYELGNNPSE